MIANGRHKSLVACDPTSCPYATQAERKEEGKKVWRPPCTGSTPRAGPSETMTSCRGFDFQKCDLERSVVEANPDIAGIGVSQWLPMAQLEMIDAVANVPSWRLNHHFFPRDQRPCNPCRDLPDLLRLNHRNASPLQTGRSSIRYLGRPALNPAWILGESGR